MIAIYSSEQTPLLYTLLFLPASYFFVLHALFAGCIYAVLGVAFIRPSVPTVLAIALGIFAGAISGYLVAEATGFSWSNNPAKTNIMYGCIVSGAICGGFFPVMTIERIDDISAALNPSNLAKTAIIDSKGFLIGKHGRCPNCQSVIALDSIACKKCNAFFGDKSNWKVKQLTQGEQELIEKRLTCDSSGPPSAHPITHKSKRGQEVGRCG